MEDSVSAASGSEPKWSLAKVLDGMPSCLVLWSDPLPDMPCQEEASAAMLHLSRSDDPKLTSLVAISLWKPFAALVNGTPYLPRCTKTVCVSPPTPRTALLWLRQVVSITEQRLSQLPGQGDVVRPPFSALGPAIPNTYILKLKVTFFEARTT